MGNSFKQVMKKEFISEKSLLAIKSIIEYLKDDVIQRDIFRATGHEAIAQQIAREINRGGGNLYRYLEESTPRDIASGLLFYLIYLKKPLIPRNIQAIVLDPGNKIVSPEIVATDVLGLLQDQLNGRHYVLLQYIMDFLSHVLKFTPTDELSGCTVPIYMMPVFFNLQAEHIGNWRHVALIFLEMIRLAPQALNINELNVLTYNLIPAAFGGISGSRRCLNDALASGLRANAYRGEGFALEMAGPYIGHFGFLV